MKTYNLIFTAYGNLNVEAETHEEALQKAKELPQYELDIEDAYVDFEIDE